MLSLSSGKTRLGALVCALLLSNFGALLSCAVWVDSVVADKYCYVEISGDIILDI